VRAVVRDRYGPPEVLHIGEVDRPVPVDDEILVRVQATTVTQTDCGWRRARPFFVRYFTGIRRPKWTTLGMEFAGEVEGVGSAVTGFATGDRVFGVKTYGAHAEFVSVRAAGAVAHMPSGLTFEQAAAICDGFCIALSCLGKADLREGRTMVVYGATGSVGTAAVQLARHVGAHVTAVSNTKNVELVRSLGADEVIDYEREDFTKNGKTYDVIFDAVGKESFRRCKGSLRPGGFYLPTDGFRNMFLWLVHKRFGDKKVVFEFPRFRKEDVLLLAELLETGRYRPVIDRVYPLEDVVEATAYVETQQKTGNVVLTVNGALS
jgi:NADPH:quinone reductase-like Zn-dependent oxidoreductase